MLCNNRCDNVNGLGFKISEQEYISILSVSLIHPTHPVCVIESTGEVGLCIHAGGEGVGLCKVNKGEDVLTVSDDNERGGEHWCC